MHVLTRSVRITLVTAGSRAHERGNSFAGLPTPSGLSAHYEFDARIAGSPDATTSYVRDIKDIDRAVREAITQRLHDAPRSTHPPELLAGFAADVARNLGGGLVDRSSAGAPGLRSLRWKLSPFLSWEVVMALPTITLLRRSYDFAAAHRLHVPTLSDAENQRLFGKCNNPRGHGHNYRFEPCVEVPASGAGNFSLQALDDACERAILSRFDHKHLNEDCAEFDVSRGGKNPSVENIAGVFFELLRAEVARALPAGCKLREVTVWETDRTCATFPA